MHSESEKILTARLIWFFDLCHFIITTLVEQDCGASWEERRLMSRILSLSSKPAAEPGLSLCKLCRHHRAQCLDSVLDADGFRKLTVREYFIVMYGAVLSFIVLISQIYC